MTATNWLEKYQNLLNEPTKDSVDKLEAFTSILNKEMMELIEKGDPHSKAQAEHKRLHRDIAKVVKEKIILIIG